MPEQAPSGEPLGDILRELAHGVPVSQQPQDEDWAATVDRIGVAGRIAKVTEETWYYFLEVLPPKLLRGGWFMFAEGQEPSRSSGGATANTSADA